MAVIYCANCEGKASDQVAKCPHCGHPFSGHVENNPVQNINISYDKTNGALGIAALVLGIIACLSCWIPFLGILSVPIAVLGVLFGTIGLLVAIVGKKTRVGFPVAGLVVSLTSIAVVFMMTGTATVAAQRTFEQIAKAEAGSNRNRTSQAKVQQPEMPAVDARVEEKSYCSKVKINNIEIAAATLGREGLFGEIKNTGEKPLKRVEITVYYLNADGDPIFEDKYHPVSDARFGGGEPLKSNYSKKFGYVVENVPSEWSKNINAVVTDIEFAD